MKYIKDDAGNLYETYSTPESEACYEAIKNYLTL
jgi:hypothetical protein